MSTVPASKVTRLIDGVLTKVRAWNITVEGLIRFLAFGAAAACTVITSGALVILAKSSEQLALAWAYPIVFGCAAIAWVVVAWHPTSTWCSIASACTTVPAMSRAIDFVVTWYQDGTDRPGSRTVGIGAWLLVVIMGTTIAFLLPLLARRNKTA